MSNKYYVRDFPLHKEIVGAGGRKSRQVYQPGDAVELTEAEAFRYQHLIETEEQYKSRVNPKAKTTK
ncbi:MAG: hypothetical protein QNJ72_14215 [Pleurocapsa sp. MO_226.B13]|nr:hypothetical protein [Pleurocapsa sp. MO_226.B13]